MATRVQIYHTVYARPSAGRSYQAYVVAVCAAYH